MSTADVRDETEDDRNRIIKYTQDISRATVQAVRCSHRLPTAGDDFDYYSSFDSFRRLMDIESSRILQLMQQILRYHGIKGNLSASSQARELEDKFDVLVDANDQLLERAGTYLDEASGVKKEAPLVVASIGQKEGGKVTTSWNKKVGQTAGPSKGASFRLLSAKNIQRPQLKFKEKVDNSHKPFVPRLQEKPNALKPLGESLLVQLSEEMEGDEPVSYPHPFKYELDHFTPTVEQLKKAEPKLPTPSSEGVSARLIETEEELCQLCEHLKQQVEIAVDTEHHSYRSYLGFTCLIQISTREQDYLIDSLALRSELYHLNTVFTDPTILKVFHGADSDVEWLQRDFGVYLVNMFDTGQAARVLGLGRYSLSHLLKHYCQVEADKQYQLADWRIRPLPEELVHYAQEDTHYLLYIYDVMKNELLERGNQQKNLLHSVLQRSQQICSKTYEKPRVHADSHKDLYRKSKKVFNSQQMSALKEIFNWRDTLARNEDESTGYVLPNHMMLQIAELLPREPQGVIACCNPVPPLVRQNLNEVHNIVKKAREVPLTKEVDSPHPRMAPGWSDHPRYKLVESLHCPHDLSHQGLRGKEEEEVGKGLYNPSVVVSQSSLFGEQRPEILVKDVPLLSIFGGETKHSPSLQTLGQRKAHQIWLSFQSPLHKYLPVSKRDSTPVLTQPKMNLSSDAQDKEKWRLLPPTKVIPQEVKTTVVAMDTTVNTGHEDKIKFEEEEEEAQPIRYQLPSKRRLDPKVTLDASTKETGSCSTEHRLKSKKPTLEEVESRGFKSHDYSSTDYGELFKDGPSGSKKEGKHKQQHGRSRQEYDPYGEQSKQKHKEVHKPKLSASSSKKSMTYSQKQPKARIPWPKR